jgi:hypothetical protein
MRSGSNGRRQAQARAAALAALVCLAAAPALALPDLSREQRAGGLVFLPDADDSHTWYVMPSHARLATDAGGRASFSLLAFSFRGDDGGENAGALLNFMLTWGLAGAEQQAAEAALKGIDPQGVIRGAVPVTSGSWRVVVKGPSGRWTLAEGKAPTLPGSQVAFSQRLDAETSKRLEQDLADPKTTVRVGFLFVCEGLGPQLDARAVYDWDVIETHAELPALTAAQADAAVPDAQVRAAFDALRSAGAIALDGAQAQAAQAQDAAYLSFRAALFQPLLAVATEGDEPLEARFVRQAGRKSGRIEVSLSRRGREERLVVATGDLTAAVRATLEAAPATD